MRLSGKPVNPEIESAVKGPDTPEPEAAALFAAPPDQAAPPVNPGIMNAIESIAYERDRQEFALGDTLDIKTGLILAALTFLALQNGDLLKSSTSSIQIALQVVSIVSLVFGGGFSIAELWPRDYGREAAPQKYLDWVAETDKYREDNPDTDTEPITAQKLIEERVKVAVLNVQTNLAINKLKSTLMLTAFIFVAVSFAANVGTLISHLF
jgi:hypothetical protein